MFAQYDGALTFNQVFFYKRKMFSFHSNITIITGQEVKKPAPV